MNYNEFKEYLIEELSRRLGGDVTLSYKEVLKNNGIILDGLILADKESNISPTVYVNDFYDCFLGGMELKEIADEIENVYNRKNLDGNFETSFFMDLESVKSKIAFKIINAGLNNKLLETVPHRNYLDLAICYYVVVDEKMISNGTILITNEHMKMWKLQEEDLYEFAMTNSPRIREAQIMDIKDMLHELIIENNREEDIDFLDGNMDGCMYVLSNKDKIFGAAAILYDDLIKNFSRKVNANLYILPSSIHEVIIVPENCVDDSDYLNDMVCEVNATQVPKSEILSDHAYFYDGEKDLLTAC